MNAAVTAASKRNSGRSCGHGVSFEAVTIHRTPGRHGHGEPAEGMGTGPRFVFEADETVYVAGDTIWYEPVEETLDRFDPDMVVLNGGEARFEQGEPITMGIEDVSAVRDATDTPIVVVHMEAINHCSLTREELRSATEDVHVPEDGDFWRPEPSKLQIRPLVFLDEGHSENVICNRL